MKSMHAPAEVVASMGRRALLEIYRLDPESKTPVGEALRLHHLLPNSSASADEREVGVKGKGSKMSLPAPGRSTGSGGLRRQPRRA